MEMNMEQATKVTKVMKAKNKDQKEKENEVVVKGECGICVEKYNKMTRKSVTCPHCDHQCCATCIKTYVLGSVHIHHCMNCRKEWSVEFMNEMFPASFLKYEYRQQRETILFEEEKTYLPALMPEAERMGQIKILEKKFNVLRMEKQKNHDNEDQLVRNQRQTERILDEKLGNVYSELHKLSLKTQKEKKEFSVKCPIGECRGFLDPKYHCGICNTDVCKDCYKNKMEEHKCDPNDVATVTELKTHTKPCPKCQVRIYKTDGCDQMFCTQCHTAFSWTTGQVELGIIHNPHYLEQLRAGNIRDPRHRQDHGGCGPVPAFEIILDVMRKAKVASFDRDEIQLYYQNCLHHRNWTLVRLAERTDRDKDRLAYLMGEMEEKTFKQRTYANHQRDARCIEERQIIESYATIMEELFRMFGYKDVRDTIQQFRTLCDVTKKALVSLDKKYQYKGKVSADEIGYRMF
jgi:hypothetical protein